MMDNSLATNGASRKTTASMQPSASKKPKLQSKDDCPSLSKESWLAAKKERKKLQSKLLRKEKRKTKRAGHGAEKEPVAPKIHSYIPKLKLKPNGIQTSTLAKVLSANTMAAVRKLGYKNITDVQAAVIPLLANGSSVRCISPPATGKSLSFLIPAIDRLRTTGFKTSAGIGVVVLSPNRGLCDQSQLELGKLLSNVGGERYTSCVAVGGDQLCHEAQRVRNANILFCTPSSLHEHLDSTPNFSIDQATCIVLDEYDFLLSHYDLVPHMRALVPKLPKKYQIVMMSSTKGHEDETLFALFMNGDKFADVDLTASLKWKLSPAVQQEYLICPTHYRLPIVQALLQQNKARKTVIFCTLDDTVRLLSGVLKTVGISNTALHDELDDAARAGVREQFASCIAGVLLCRDVDVIGWHMAGVDCVLHVDPPLNTSIFAHRVGMAARDLESKGVSVALLRPEETCYLELLQEQLSAILLRRNIALGHLPGLQATAYMAVHNTPGLKEVAERALTLYRNSYRRLKPKTMFPFQGLHRIELEAAFGLVGVLPKTVITVVEQRMQPYLRQLDEWEN